MTNRPAIKEAESQALDARNRCSRLSIKTRWLYTRVSTFRRVGPKPASQHQDASARSPRLSIKAHRTDARASASRRIGPTPSPQHPDVKARSPRLKPQGAFGSTPASQTSRRVWPNARVSVATALIAGPVTAHVAGSGPSFGSVFRRHLHPLRPL